jgi:hypothetical protein
MTALLAFFGAGPARLQALLIAALALIALCLSLTVWALIERTWRLQDAAELATLKAQQAQVLADSLGRCNAGVENAAKAGVAAVADTKRLLGMAEVAMQKTAALREEARAIVSKAPPARADGKAKDCTDALAEIKAKVKP